MKPLGTTTTYDGTEHAYLRGHKVRIIAVLKNALRADKRAAEEEANRARREANRARRVAAERAEFERLRAKFEPTK